jgi:hypothetical protein
MKAGDTAVAQNMLLWKADRPNLVRSVEEPTRDSWTSTVDKNTGSWMLMMEALKPRSLMREEDKNTERLVERHSLEEIGWFSGDGVSATSDYVVE